MRSVESLFEDGLVWLARADSARANGGKTTGLFRASPRLKNVVSRDRLDRAEEEALCFGVAEIDLALGGGLAADSIHEWYFPDSHEYFPLLLPVYLSAGRLRADADKHVFWIGRKAWPSPHVLREAGGEKLISSSIFIDPPDNKSLLEVFETILRSRVAASVTAIVGNLSFVASRRLALAARSGKTPGIILRGQPVASRQSAAASSWRIGHIASENMQPRLEVELLRQKGSGLSSLSWQLDFYGGENERQKISLYVPPGVEREAGSKAQRRFGS